MAIPCARSALAILVVAVPAAQAAPAPPTPARWVADTADDGPVFLRQIVPGSGATGLAQTRVIYLDRHGGALAPGPTDARAHTSSLIRQPAVVRGWDASPADWAATVSCLTAIYARFDVTITDVDPGDAPHLTAMFGGSPADLGMPDKLGGVSPFTEDCSVIERSIVFAFTDNLPRRPRIICEVMAQEIAHSYGLDHELVAADPMTYLPYAGDRTFQDVTAPCGETVSRACGIGGSVCRPNQNSVQLLLARLGAAGTSAPPAPTADPLPAGCATSATPPAPGPFVILLGWRARRRLTAWRGSDRSPRGPAPRRSPPAGSDRRR
jgi:hypothetical protein